MNWQLKETYKELKTWKEHKKYFEWQYLKYLHKDKGISNNAKEIILCLKATIKGLEREIDERRNRQSKANKRNITYCKGKS